MAREHVGDERVLRRFRPLPVASDTALASDGCLIALYVDVETTGLDTTIDKITELAMQPFAFDKDGVIRGVWHGSSWLNDPGIPIPPDIAAKTGITDDMVRGQSINVEAVRHALSAPSLVIAHNAGFDRKMCEAFGIPEFALKRWACAMNEVPWREQYGVSCRNLGHLLMDLHDEFFEAHRASADVEVGIKLLTSQDTEGRTALSYLYESMTSTVRVQAIGAPFAMKDALKMRGYQWAAERKFWHWSGLKEPARAELAWLKAQGVTQAFATSVNPKDRYSVRDL